MGGSLLDGLPEPGDCDCFCWPPRGWWSTSEYWFRFADFVDLQSPAALPPTSLVSAGIAEIQGSAFSLVSMDGDEVPSLRASAAREISTYADSNFGVGAVGVLGLGAASSWSGSAPYEPSAVEVGPLGYLNGSVGGASPAPVLGEVGVAGRRQTDRPGVGNAAGALFQAPVPGGLARAGSLPAAAVAPPLRAPRSDATAPGSPLTPGAASTASISTWGGGAAGPATDEVPLAVLVEPADTRVLGLPPAEPRAPGVASPPNTGYFGFGGADAPAGAGVGSRQIAPLDHGYEGAGYALETVTPPSSPESLDHPDSLDLIRPAQGRIGGANRELGGDASVPDHLVGRDEANASPSASMSSPAGAPRWADLAPSPPTSIVDSPAARNGSGAQVPGSGVTAPVAGSTLRSEGHGAPSVGAFFGGGDGALPIPSEQLRGGGGGGGFADQARARDAADAAASAKSDYAKAKAKADAARQHHSATHSEETGGKYTETVRKKARKALMEAEGAEAEARDASIAATAESNARNDSATVDAYLAALANMGGNQEQLDKLIEDERKRQENYDDWAVEREKKKRARTKNYDASIAADRALRSSRSSRDRNRTTKRTLSGIKGRGLNNPKSPAGRAAKSARAAIKDADRARKEAKSAAKKAKRSSTYGTKEQAERAATAASHKAAVADAKAGLAEAKTEETRVKADPSSTVAQTKRAEAESARALADVKSTEADAARSEADAAAAEAEKHPDNARKQKDAEEKKAAAEAAEKEATTTSDTADEAEDAAAAAEAAEDDDGESGGEEPTPDVAPTPASECACNPPCPPGSLCYCHLPPPGPTGGGGGDEPGGGGGAGKGALAGQVVQPGDVVDPAAGGDARGGTDEPVSGETASNEQQPEKSPPESPSRESGEGEGDASAPEESGETPADSKETYAEKPKKEPPPRKKKPPAKPKKGKNRPTIYASPFGDPISYLWPEDGQDDDSGGDDDDSEQTDDRTTGEPESSTTQAEDEDQNESDEYGRPPDPRPAHERYRRIRRYKSASSLEKAKAIAGTTKCRYALYMTQARNTVLMHEVKTARDRIWLNALITKAYAQLYLSDPVKFKWAGVAAFESERVGWAMSAAYTASETGQAAGELLDLDTESHGNPIEGGEVSGGGLRVNGVLFPHTSVLFWLLAEGNLEIFLDSYWQFLAYAQGGLPAIAACYIECYLSPRQFLAWLLIDSGDPTAGAAALAVAEQMEVLDPIIHATSDREQWMSLLALLAHGILSVTTHGTIARWLSTSAFLEYGGHKFVPFIRGMGVGPDFSNGGQRAEWAIQSEVKGFANMEKMDPAELMRELRRMIRRGSALQTQPVEDRGRKLPELQPGK